MCGPCWILSRSAHCFAVPASVLTLGASCASDTNNVFTPIPWRWRDTCVTRCRNGTQQWEWLSVPRPSHYIPWIPKHCCRHPLLRSRSMGSFFKPYSC